jgi:hypothetical protein
MHRTEYVDPLDALTQYAEPQRKICPNLKKNKLKWTIYIGRMYQPPFNSTQI